MEPLTKEILTFWFGTLDLSVEMEKRQVWFRATPEFDRYLVDHYTGVHERASAGELDHFKETPEDCLALIMALDQFPRNIFRGTPRAFATDPKARETAGHALAAGYDRRFSRWPRTFIYLPFEHSERIADQERALVLYRSLDNEDSMRAAVGHHDAIKRFGRFPAPECGAGSREHPRRGRVPQGPAPVGQDRGRGGGAGGAEGRRKGGRVRPSEGAWTGSKPARLRTSPRSDSLSRSVSARVPRPR